MRLDIFQLFLYMYIFRCYRIVFQVVSVNELIARKYINTVIKILKYMVAALLMTCVIASAVSLF